MDSEQAVVLAVVASEPEAEALCGLLGSVGIECAYRDTEAIGTPLEDFIASGPREVLVHAKDLEAAQALLPGAES
jgi:Putative prokaryotic signal transducing protein